MKGLKVAGIFVGGWAAGTVINIKLIKKAVKFAKESEEIQKIIGEAFLDSLDRNKELVIEIITYIMCHYGYKLNFHTETKEENKDEDQNG